MAEEKKKEESEWQDQSEQTRGQSAQADPQTGSLFFQRLPQEMRDHIYTLLFSSTTLMFRAVFSDDTTIPAPIGDGLALLRVCRRAKIENGDSWFRHVVLDFRRSMEMLYSLFELPAKTFSKLRHIRITSGILLTVDHPAKPRATSGFIPLYPFSIIDDGKCHHSYETLDSLIEEGNGWKTLRYICYDSSMLGFASVPGGGWPWRPWRKSQPMHWQMVMEGRDGMASNPSVTVYRAKQPGPTLARGGYESLFDPNKGVEVEQKMLDPNKRVKFEQKMREGQYLWRDFPEDPELMTGDEQGKALLVIVNRGSGVDYEIK
ncbi:hypothetical protein B0I37DRAFT_431690 [Chaetomium sp. MPI-CAGE-AT-0009]|nr:hypothetical protein B0I37DRAFT_431690 [Chaetomium sp. MPI-CAGE-AT-0009]